MHKKKQREREKLLTNKWETNYEIAYKKFINLSKSEELKV
jgi:hypothetical protein